MPLLSTFGMALIALIAIAISLPAAAERLAPAFGAGTKIDSLDKALPGYSLARCIFPRGRLVLEKDGDFLVLRQGDRLPGDEGLKVLRISDTRAILVSDLVVIRDPDGAAEGKSGSVSQSVPVPGRMILIEVSAEGVTTITAGSATPPAGSVSAFEDSGELGVVSRGGGGSSAGALAGSVASDSGISGLVAGDEASSDDGASHDGASHENEVQR